MAAGPRKAFPLRLDPAVHAAIERLAAQELRSTNAQMEFLLREALERRGVRLKQDAASKGEAGGKAR
ncbi:MAG: hypothetical protein R3C52_14545 [Hyphomonadaceae bacterium]